MWHLQRMPGAKGGSVTPTLNTASLQALTLWPEWAWAVSQLGKDVENRAWPKPPFALVGRCLAIHAGKRVGGGVSTPDEALEVMLATAEFALGARPDAPDLADVPTSAIVAVVRIGEVGFGLPSPWSAPEGWQLGFSDIAVFPAPLPCSGHQGLWQVPAEVLVELRRCWPEARRERRRFAFSQEVHP